MATTTTRSFTCPDCKTSNDVEVQVARGNSVGQLAVRFDCAGCGVTFNATTDKLPTVWRDRLPGGS